MSDCPAHRASGGAWQRTPVRAGLCSVTLRSLPPSEVIEVAAEAGLEAIEWGGDVHVPPGDVAAAEKVARVTADAGLVVPSYGSYLRAGSVDVASACRENLDVAQALGATNIRVWTDWATVDGTPTERRKAIAADLATIADAAAARAMTVSMEFHAFTLTETAASTLRLLDEAGMPPNLFTYWQPMDGRPVSESLDELSTVLANLSHLHVFWWRSFDERLPLDDGAQLWRAAFDLIVEQDCAGGSEAASPRWPGPRYAFLEFVRGDAPDQLRADSATLRGLLSDARSP